MSAHVNPIASDLPTDWMARGACKGKADLFVPGTVAGGWVNPEARAICRGCPVRVPCGSYADATDPEGVWAGLSQRERRRAKRGGV